MACSMRMSKRKLEKENSPRSCRPRSAGELVGAVGDQSFRRFGFVQGSIVSRWGEIVGERYAKVSSPESIRFPAGQEGRRGPHFVGRRGPCAAHPAPDADDRRAGQPLLRPCRDQPHRLPPGQSLRRPRPPRLGRSSDRCRRNSAKACERSPIPSFARAWSCLPRELALAAARLRIDERNETIPVIKGAK